MGSSGTTTASGRPRERLEGRCLAKGEGAAMRADEPCEAPTPRPWTRDPFSYVVAVWSALVWLPYARYVTWLGDEGVLPRAATEMLGGATLYRDVFGILPPLPYALTAAWFSVFGTDWLTFRLLGMLVLTAGGVVAYRLCRLLVPMPWAAALLPCLWLLWAEGAWSGLSHHGLTTLFALGAIHQAFVAMSRTRAAFVAGLLVGAAGMTASARGAPLFVAVGLVLATSPSAIGGNRPSRLRRLVPYVIGVGVIPLLLIAWLALWGSPADAFAGVIEFPLHHYSGIQAVPFGNGVSGLTLPTVLMFPVTLALALGVSVLRRGRPLAEPRFRAAVLFAGVGVASAYPRPDAVHLVFVLPLLFPLFLLASQESLRLMKGHWRAVAVGVGVLACVPSAVAAATQAAHAAELPLTPTARGPVRLGDFFETPDFPEVMRRLDATAPDSRVFFYPYAPLLPYLAARRQVSRYDIFTPGYTTPAQYYEACNAALGDADWVVWQKDWTRPEILKAVFPALEDPEPPATREFEVTLRAAFEPVVELDHALILRRRPGSTAACTLWQP